MHKTGEKTLTSPKTDQIAVIGGATQGIGLALLKQLLLDNSYQFVFGTYRSTSNLSELKALKAEYEQKLILIEFDSNLEDSVSALALKIQSHVSKVDLCINSIGILATENLQPERSLEEVTTDSLLKSFQVNTITSLLLAQKLKPLMLKSEAPVFIALSAKVGSLADNRLGGWYSYRISKAALNMVIKNLSIEMKRLHKSFIVMAVHPGTTTTQLSKPFMPSAKKKYKIHSPLETAQNIFKILEKSHPKTHNGQFFSWDRTKIPW